MRMSAPDPMQILLVEDNTSDALLVEELLSILEHPTFHVQHAARLGTAEEILAQSEFDAALLDLGLPDSQGLETVRNFQAMADLPIVVLTGQDDQLTGTEAIHLGAQDFLPKAELTEQLLARALRYAVERHRLEEERRLCYVGMTRAMEKLYLTNARRRRVYGSYQFNRPSRFLGEIPAHLVERPVSGKKGAVAAQSSAATHNLASLFAQLPAEAEEREIETSPESAPDSISQPTTPRADEPVIEVEPSAPPERGLRIGSRVEHARFGIGTVRRIEGSGDKQKVIVYFNRFGPKRLLLKFAGLEVL